MNDPSIAVAMLGSGARRRGVARARIQWHAPIACWLLSGVLAVCAFTAFAAEPTGTQQQSAPPVNASEGFRNLDTDVQNLKKEVLDLNRDLVVLEEELLFPASTQVAVFLSMDVGTFFELDSVQVRLGDKEVANHLYTEREVDALHRGGVHRLHLGNVKTGRHELVAFFVGKGPHERDYKRGATLTFEKGAGAKYVELRISDRRSQMQPEFLVREWE
jgi:hypothetical protein